MQVFNLDSTVASKISHLLITPAHQLQWKFEFRAPVTDFDANRRINVMNAFNAAIGGAECSVSYSNPSSRQAVTLYPRKPLADIMEMCASMTGKVLIRYKETITVGIEDCDVFTVTVLMDISRKGTMKFGRENTLNIVIAGLEPPDVDGTVIPGVVTVDLDTIISPVFSNELVVITPMVSQVDSETGFDSENRSVIFFPGDISNLKLNAVAGTDTEVDVDQIEDYFEHNLPPHIVVDGLIGTYHKWIPYPMAGVKSGRYTMATSTTAYSLTTQDVV